MGSHGRQLRGGGWLQGDSLTAAQNGKEWERQVEVHAGSPCRRSSCKKTRIRVRAGAGAKERREYRTEAEEAGAPGTEEGETPPGLEVLLEEKGAFEGFSANRR